MSIEPWQLMAFIKLIKFLRPFSPMIVSNDRNGETVNEIYKPNEKVAADLRTLVLSITSPLFNKFSMIVGSN